VSKGKAFFSTLPGVISGVAGALTAVVGLLTVAVQLGWIGGDDADSGDPATSTVAGGTAGAGGAGGAGTTAAGPGRLSVTPPSIRFVALQAREETVTVRNDGGPVTLSVEVTGPDKAQFRAVPVDCPTPLATSRTCPVEVTFTPTRAGRYQATLVLTPSRGTAVEVPIEGNHLL